MSEGIDTSLLIGLLGYLAIVLALGIYASQKMKKLDDYLLAGRKLGAVATAISERASGESAWFLLGLPGAAYAVGFTEYWTVIGSAAGIFASWVVIAIPLRRYTAKHGAITLPDYFVMRFGDNAKILRSVAMAIILFFYTAYVAAQFVGGAKILAATFDLDMKYGLVLGALVVTFYTLMGGLLAVVWTDVIQGFLMAAVAVILPILGIMHLGGPNAFVDSIAAKGPELLTMSGGKTGAAFLFGVMIGSLSWGFGYLGQPHLLTRYMAAKGTRQLKTGAGVAISWVLIAYWSAPLIGMVGIGLLGPDIADPEMVMPLVARTLLPGWIAGIFIAGAVAAMMSTADSQLLVATSAVVQDFYVRLLGRTGATPNRLVMISRFSTLGIALVALSLAFSSEEMIYDMVSYAWAGLGSSFGPPLVLSLRWKRITRWGVLAGMLAGTISNIIWNNVDFLDDAIDLKFATFMLSLIFTVVVSLVTRTPEEEGYSPARAGRVHP